MEKGIDSEVAADVVREFSSFAPSAAFTLVRVNENGTRKEIPLRIRLLRNIETIQAMRDAQSYAREMGEVSKEYGDIYKEAQAVELIRRSLCRPNEEDRGDGTRFYRPMFASSGQLRETFTENEIAQCLQGYELTKAKYSAIQSFDPEEIDRWAARLSDTLLGPFFLSKLDSSHWPALMSALAERVQALSVLAGVQLQISDDSSQSDPSSSESGTGGSSSSRSAFLKDEQGEPMPSDKLLSRDEARKRAKKLRDGE